MYDIVIVGAGGGGLYAAMEAIHQNPKAKIAVCGCLTQLNRNFIEKTGADFIVSQDKKYFVHFHVV